MLNLCFILISKVIENRNEVSYSSGVNVTTLEQVTYISLDTFRERTENKVKNALDAWLRFFTAEEPADVIRLATEWPMFLPMYKDIASFRKDPAKIMGYFSEALYIMFCAGAFSYFFTFTPNRSLSFRSAWVFSPVFIYFRPNEFKEKHEDPWDRDS